MMRMSSSAHPLRWGTSRPAATRPPFTSTEARGGWPPTTLTLSTCPDRDGRFARDGPATLPRGKTHAHEEDRAAAENVRNLVRPSRCPLNAGIRRVTWRRERGAVHEF